MNICIFRHLSVLCFIALLPVITGCSDLEYEAEKVEIFYEGQFIDSGPVDGLRYETETQQGVTNSGGMFKYKKREYITFYVGNIQLGDTIKAKELISPVDLVAGTVKIENQSITNISRFLQSVSGVSTDKTLSISDEVVQIVQSQVSDNEINFNVSPDLFNQDSKIISIFDNLNKTSGSTTAYTLVSATEAQEKLKTNLVQAEGETEYESYTNTIHTSFEYYPLAGYFDRPENIYISTFSETIPITPDNNGGFRHIIKLETGQANSISITASRYEKKIGALTFHITHDDAISYTNNHQLLYSYSADKIISETIIIDLEAKNAKGFNGVIVGYLENIDIVACSNDNQFLIDTKGQVYLSSTHEPVGAPLPYSQTGESTFYPLFSPDDRYCYAGTIKVDFEVWKAIYVDKQITSGTWVYKHFPVWVDSRYATITDDDRYLFQTKRMIPKKIDPVNINKTVYEVAVKIDLFTDEVVDTIDIQETNVVMRVTLGDMIVSPDGSTGFLTTYSNFYGALDILDLNRRTAIKNIDGLSDYLGNIVFINNYQRILFGSSGNSWYGGGNVYILKTNGEMLTRLNQLGASIMQYGDSACGSTGYAACGQYGAFAVALDRDETLYISSRYLEELGSQKELNNCSPDRRGIDQLKINDNGSLDFIQTFYLNSTDRKTMHFVKGK
ncbi:MAG: hypothetical protein HQK75_05815 [Candidatus Magnetomorum sp.]|nr:hypothetical protein [Candidatus Magnetomorum sp.]